MFRIFSPSVGFADSSLVRGSQGGALPRLIHQNDTILFTDVMNR